MDLSLPQLLAWRRDWEGLPSLELLWWARIRGLRSTSPKALIEFFPSSGLLLSCGLVVLGRRALGMGNGEGGNDVYVGPCFIMYVCGTSLYSRCLVVLVLVFQMRGFLFIWVSSVGRMKWGLTGCGKEEDALELLLQVLRKPATPLPPASAL